ncbi:Protein rds1, partial [Lachnellula suecica]
MRSSIISALITITGLAAAAPIEDRSSNAIGDATILNYALTLEYLERKFYQEGLVNYTEADFTAAGAPAPFYANLKEIYVDEQTHVSTLAGALKAAGATPVKEAMYSFPVKDAKSFLGLSSVLEGVGVSAYLGAAGEIANKAYLTVAGSILTVEARHSAYIRAGLKQVPFPKPFDTPLDFNQVFSLAAQFITGFAPGDAALPFKAFPAISVAYAGSSVTFKNAQKNAMAAGLCTSSTPVYAVFFSGLDTYYVKATAGGGDFRVAKVPVGAEGQ